MIEHLTEGVQHSIAGYFKRGNDKQKKIDEASTRVLAIVKEALQSDQVTVIEGTIPLETIEVWVKADLEARGEKRSIVIDWDELKLDGKSPQKRCVITKK